MASNIKDDIKEMNEMIEFANENLNTLKEMTINNIKSYGLHPKIFETIDDLSLNDINNITPSELQLFLNRSRVGNEIDNYESLKLGYESNEDFKDKKEIDYIKYVLTDIKKSVDDYHKLEKDKDDLTGKMNQWKEDYFNYINSDEYKDIIKKKINSLKNRLNEVDGYEKIKIMQLIEGMEKSENITFLYNQINKKGEKEINNIHDIYFNNNRSSLVMSKFKSKIVRFGYSENIYRGFFNLEENFLPEKYHKYNNLFLFHIMRTISFFDPDSKVDGLYTSAIFLKLHNLNYHSFRNQDDENEFLDFIMKFEDQFDKFDDFEEKNSSYKNHPARMESEKRLEEQRKILIINQLNKLGVKPDLELSSKELREMLDDIIDKKSKGEEEVKENDVSNLEINKDAIVPITKEIIEEADSEINENSSNESLEENESD